MIDWELYQRLRREKFFSAQDIELPEEPDERQSEDALRVLLAQRLLAATSGEQLPEQLASVAGVSVDGASAWCELPLLVEGEGRATVFPVLLGLLQVHDVRIEAGWLCPDAEDAAGKALSLAGQGRQGFVLLRRDVQPGAGISGSSLGLPLAIAGRRLAEGQAGSCKALATGAVDEHGAVCPVGAVKIKHGRAVKTKGCFFLYPKANEADLPPDADRACPVASLEEALALCGLDGGDSVVLRLLPGWSKAPHGFFAWLDSGEFSSRALPALLAHAESAGWLQGTAESPLLAEAVNHLYSWREKNHPGQDTMRRLLAYFPLDAVLKQDLPALPLLRLAGMNSTLSFQKGEGDSHWREISSHCWKNIGTADMESALEVLVAVARDANGCAHNAYRFCTPLPKDWLARVEKYTEFCRQFGIAESKSLGKAYGMLTERAALAGDFRSALNASELSLSFFSDTRDRRRRRLDRTYIFCDMGRAEDATRELGGALASCLGASSEEAIAPNGSSLAVCEDPFVHAAFVRLCLSMPALFAGYPVEKILKTQFQPWHPWQCWARNCGQLLASSNPALARTCLHEAIGICLHNRKETTLTPMALLPLSALAHLRLEPMEQVCLLARPILAQLRELCRSGHLCKEHFRTVLEASSTASALEAVEREQARLFPFNYR